MVAAIDIAAISKERSVKTTHSALNELDCALTASVHSAAKCSAPIANLRGEMEQASAAFTTVEAELVGLHQVVSDHMAVSSDTQHDSDSDFGHTSPASSCCDDSITDEHMEDIREADSHAHVPTDSQQFGSGTVRYTRHQGTHHRPAVRWLDATDMQQGAQQRHSPQHSMLSPNKSCIKQGPEGSTYWFAEAQPEQTPASIRPWLSRLTSIDGKQGRPVLPGRKRSRACSLD